MDHPQEPLAAGLLAGFVSLISPPESSNQTLSILASDDNGSGGGGKIHSWSSLIGIFTALAGNVLISLALNIQRYAHIRIDREFVHDKIQRETDWKRARSGRGTTGAYGAVAEGGSAARGRQHEQSFESYRDVSPDFRDARDGNLDARARQNTRLGGKGSASHGDLDESILSDQTIRPEDKNLQHGHRKSYLRSPYWWVGIVLMVLGETGNFMAYGFAPASIVSPLGVVALISNCVIAPIMLKEQFRKRDLWGIIVAIAGAAVVVLSAKTSEEKIGPHDIWVMITRWEFELYLGLTIGLIVALMSLSGKYGSRTILIDVGLVALFGMSLSSQLIWTNTHLYRWIYCFIDQRCLLTAVIHTLACDNLSYHLSSGVRPCFQRFDANSLYKQSLAAV